MSDNKLVTCATKDDLSAEAAAREEADSQLNEAVSGLRDDLDAHVSETAAGTHGATSSVVTESIVIRDSDGRAKIAYPSDADDIATKGYVDNMIVSGVDYTIENGTYYVYTVAGFQAWAEAAAADFEGPFNGVNCMLMNSLDLTGIGQVSFVGFFFGNGNTLITDAPHGLFSCIGGISDLTVFANIDFDYSDTIGDGDTASFYAVASGIFVGTRNINVLGTMSITLSGASNTGTVCVGAFAGIYPLDTLSNVDVTLNLAVSGTIGTAVIGAVVDEASDVFHGCSGSLSLDISSLDASETCVGGIAGKSSSGLISCCSGNLYSCAFNASSYNSTYVGGIVGLMEEGSNYRGGRSLAVNACSSSIFYDEDIPCLGYVAGRCRNMDAVDLQNNSYHCYYISTSTGYYTLPEVGYEG